MKIVIKAKPGKALVLWTTNNYPFVVASTPDQVYQVGQLIPDWYWGKYFETIDEALTEFNKEVA